MRNVENAAQSENLVGQGKLIDSVAALLVKRFNIYKRDKCGLVCEILVPVILCLMGLGLLQIGFLSNSEAFYLNTEAYPGPQRLLFNQNNVDTTITNQYSTETIFSNFPGTDYFEATYDSTATSYNEYYVAVTE